VRNMAAESPVEAYAGKPIKVLGPDSGNSEPAATPDATPYQASNSNANNSAPVSQGVIQDNGLLTILLLGLCIAVIIVCAVAYLFVFKRM